MTIIGSDNNKLLIGGKQYPLIMTPLEIEHYLWNLNHIQLEVDWSLLGENIYFKLRKRNVSELSPMPTKFINSNQEWTTKTYLIEKYSMLNPVNTPPIIVINNFVQDGNHRLLAFKNNGIKSILAYTLVCDEIPKDFEIVKFSPPKNAIYE